MLWLFPPVAPDQRRALSAWSKLFGHYLRNQIGVTDPDRVFHSFRHSFQDALRRATPDASADALPGRSSRSKSVSRDYGAKYMLDRWGVETLRKTIEAISYPGSGPAACPSTGQYNAYTRHQGSLTTYRGHRLPGNQQEEKTAVSKHGWPPSYRRIRWSKPVTRCHFASLGRAPPRRRWHSPLPVNEQVLHYLARAEASGAVETNRKSLSWPSPPSWLIC